MTLLKITIILVGLAFAACQLNQSDKKNTDTRSNTKQASSKPTAVADLEKTVLAVHDSIMPAMSDLISLKKAVSGRIAELDAKPASAETHQLKAQGVAINTELSNADHLMMDWMHHYNGDTLVTLNEQQAMAYLTAQQQKVNTLRELIKKSITDAQAYLK
ncbi:hypothetical protein GCM10028805_57840 [Spirosoma harenae]